EILKTRDLSISHIRFLAMLFIVSCHIMQYYDCEWTWWFNVGVQIFLCVSGFLYGNREFAKNGFIIHSFSKILISYYIVFLVFGGIHCFYLGTTSLKTLISGLFTFVHLPGGGHLWFVFTILCCYAITPLLYLVFKKTDNRALFAAKCSLTLVFVHIFFSEISWLILRMSFVPAWINCYIMGFILARVLCRSRIEQLVFILIVTILCFTLNGIKIYFTYIHELQFNANCALYQYAHSLLGVCLFVAFKKIFDRYQINPIILKLSDNYSYEVYLLHQYFILGPFTLMVLTPYGFINVIIIALMVCVLAYVVKMLSLLIRKVLILFFQAINVG
ncbi:MAG: acyltransferase, partial [Lachnospiraceae bacterium]|nr:acyltransferase [Lachnospiraceae bacterium]